MSLNKFTWYPSKMGKAETHAIMLLFVQLSTEIKI